MKTDIPVTHRTVSTCRRSITGLCLLASLLFSSGSHPLCAEDQKAPEDKPIAISIPSDSLGEVDLEAGSVFLEFDEFRELWKKAQENKKANRAPDCTGVTYEATLADKLLTIKGTFTLRSYSDHWQSWKLPVKQMAVVSASINDQPALLGNAAEGPVLFLNEAGTMTLNMEFAVPVRPTGSDQVINFSLPPVPSGSMTLTLPAGKRLLANTQSLQEESTDEGEQQYSFPVGNQRDWTLRVTEKNGETKQDRLFIASTVFTTYTKASEISWTATTELEVSGQPLDIVTCTVPGQLEVMSVTSTGLDAWELAEDPMNPKRTQITLNYRQGITGKRQVTIQGVTTADNEGRWLFPNLIVDSADSQWGEIGLGYSAPWKVRVESLEGVRRKSEPTARFQSPDQAGRALYFDIWRPDFELRLLNEMTKAGYHAALASVLSVEEQEVGFQSQLTLEATGGELFNFEFSLPANWEIESIRAGEQRLLWKTLMSEPGEQRVQVPLPSVLLPGGTVTIQIDTNLVEWSLATDNQILLPQLKLPEADLVEGTLIIQAEDRFKVQHLSSESLEPVILGLPRERLSYRFHEGDYSGEISIESKPPLVVAQTTSLARLEKKELITQHEILLDVANAPIYSLILTVTDVGEEKVQFTFPQSNIRVTAERLGAEQGGEQNDTSSTWRLGFSQPVVEQHLLYFETRQPRGDDEGLFVLPEIRFDGVDRQYGTLLVEAEPEQRIETTTLDSVNQPLPEQPLTNIAFLNIRLQSRLVAAYSYVRKGYRWSIEEERFERSGLPVAFCDEASLTSVVTSTGEIQNELRQEFRTANTQSLLLQFAGGNVELWSTMLNGEPVPVRKSPEGFQISLAPDKAPGESQVLEILYSRPMAELTATSRIEEQPPQVFAIDGSGQTQEMIMIAQNWTVRYPHETTIIDSAGDFHPPEPLLNQRTRWLNNGLQQLKRDFWWRALLVLGFLVAVNVIIHVTKLLSSNWKAVAVICVGLVLIGGTASLLLNTIDDTQTAGVRFAADGDITPESMPVNAPKNREQRIQALVAIAKGSDEIKRGRAVMKLEQLLGTEEARKLLASVSNDDLPNNYSLGLPEEAAQHGEFRDKNDNSNNIGLGNFGLPEGIATQMEQGGKGDSASDAELTSSMDTPARKSRLSIAMSLPVADNMREEYFEYYGSTPGSLKLVLRDQQHDQGVIFALFAAVLLLFWAFHRLTMKSYCTAIILAIFIPLALLWIVPAIWLPWLLGILLGAVAGLIFKLIELAVTRCAECCFTTKSKAVTTAATLLLIVGMSSTVFAQQQQSPNREALQQSVESTVQTDGAVSERSEDKPAPPSNILKQPNAWLFLMNEERDPRTVVLRPEQHRRLWKKAYDALPGEQPERPAPIVASAGYTGDLSSLGESKSFTLIGKFVVFAFDDKPAEVQLPLKNVTLNSATIDGEAAELESRLVDDEQQYWLHLQSEGLQIVEVELQVAVKHQDSSGQFTLPLLPVSSGLLSITLPGEDLQVSVAGTFLPWRQEEQENGLLVEQPISTGGNLEVKWQPKSSREDSSAIVHADSIVDVELAESGGTISHRTNVRVRRGSLSQVNFAIPEGTKVREIKGVDVGGWSILKEEGRPQLQILFRRSVTETTDLDVELFQPTSPGEAEGTLNIDQLGLLNLNRATGTIAIHAPSHLSLKVNKQENLNQINPSELPAEHQQSNGQKLAFRYHAVPYALSMSVWQKKTTSEVHANHAISIERQAVEYTSTFGMQITGEPLLHLEFDLPADFLPIDVLADQLDDWYIEREADAAPRLILEFAEPQQGNFNVVLSGKILKEIETEAITVTFPQAIGMDRIHSAAGVWFSEYYTPRLTEQGDWKTEATSQLDPQLLLLRSNSPRFAFRSPRGNPTPIEFDIMRTQAQMTANAVTLVNVSDTSLAYTLALKWTITHGGADQFVFTVPSWLKGELELNGTGIRQAVESDADDNRVRWVIETQRLQQQEYFITALATLELPKEGTFDVPLIEFERAQKQEADVRYLPFELSQNDLIVVNQSLAHVKQVSGTTTVIDKSQIPVNIEDRFLDQAVAIARIAPDSDPPVWQISWSQQFRSAPAQILLADIMTTIAHDGSVRGKVIYTMRNNARQHLAFELPESVKLLSILVGGNPTRAVEGKVNGSAVKLIPLPKQSEFGLSYPIEVAFESEPVTRSFLQQFQLFARDIAMPVPLVIDLSQSDEWGIPVLHTKWTVYAPKNYEFDYITGADKTNLSENYDARRAAKLAALEEARMYLKSMKEMSVLPSSSAPMSGEYRQNLETLQSRLSEVQSDSGSYSKLNRADEQARQELQQQLESVQQEVQSELNRQESQSQQQGSSDHTWGFSRDNSQRIYLNEMNSSLIESNGVVGIQTDNRADGVMFDDKDRLSREELLDRYIDSKSDRGRGQQQSNGQARPQSKSESQQEQSPKSSRARGEQSGRSFSNAIALTRTPASGKKEESESSSEGSPPAQQQGQIDDAANLGIRMTPFRGNGTAPEVGNPFQSQTVPNLNLPSLDNWNGNGTIVGLSSPGTFSSDSRDRTGQPQAGTQIQTPMSGGVGGGTQNGPVHPPDGSGFFVVHIDPATTDPRGVVLTNGRPEIQISAPSATLSLPISIPREGQQLEFIKAGGRPRLILTARSEQLWTTLLAILLSVVSLLAGWLCYRHMISRNQFAFGLLMIVYLAGFLCVLLGSVGILIVGVILLLAAALYHFSLIRYQRSMKL